MLEHTQGRSLGMNLKNSYELLTIVLQYQCQSFERS